MSMSTLFRNTCVVSAFALLIGCASEPAKPVLTPQQQSIAALSYNQKAERFMELIYVDKMTVPLYRQVQGMFEELYIVSKAPESKKPVLERYQAKANAILDKNIGWDILKPQVVKFYTTAFSEDELAKLIEFYDSPVGQKMLKQLPNVSIQTMQLLQSKEAVIGPQLESLIEQMAKEVNFKLNNARR